jgi:hypothetical protein
MVTRRKPRTTTAAKPSAVATNTPTEVENKMDETTTQPVETPAPAPAKPVETKETEEKPRVIPSRRVWPD